MSENKHNGMPSHARVFGLFSSELLIILAIFIISLVAFLGIANFIYDNKLVQLDIDRQGFEFFSQEISDTGMKVMKIITFLGSTGFLIMANLFLFVYYLYFTKHRWYSIKVPVVASGSVIILVLLKLFFERPRPVSPFIIDASGFSFPSGHSMSAMTFYGLLIYIIWKGRSKKPGKFVLTALLAILIMLIGVSRIYLRVHYLSDVVGGFLMGVLWLVFSLTVLSYVENYFERKRKSLAA